MKSYPHTVILRHRKENLKKCSLRGLELRKDLNFFTYPNAKLPDLTNYFLLAFEGPLLTEEDNEKGLLIIDGTWRLAEVMYHQTSALHSLEKRSLPPEIKTAYPRRQEDCQDKARGLASVEALYAAYKILGRESISLLENYYWKDTFLEINKKIFKKYA